MGDASPGQMLKFTLEGVREIVTDVASEVGVDSPPFSFAPTIDAAFGDFSTDVLLRVARIARANMVNLETRTRSLLESRSLGELVTVVRGFINLKLPVWSPQLSMDDNGLVQVMGPHYAVLKSLCIRVSQGSEPLSSWGRARLAALATMQAIFAAREGSDVTVDVLARNPVQPIVVPASTDEGELLAYIHALLSGEATTMSRREWYQSDAPAFAKVVLWSPRGGRGVSGHLDEHDKDHESDADQGPVVTPFVARRWLEDPAGPDCWHTESELGQGRGNWGGEKSCGRLGGGPDFVGLWRGKHARALAWYLAREEEFSLLDPHVALYAESANWIWFSGELVAELDRMLSDDKLFDPVVAQSNVFLRLEREVLRLPWVLRYGVTMAQPVAIVTTMGRLLDLTCQLLTGRGRYMGPVAGSATGGKVAKSDAERYVAQIIRLVWSRISSILSI